MTHHRWCSKVDWRPPENCAPPTYWVPETESVTRQQRVLSLLYWLLLPHIFVCRRKSMEAHVTREKMQDAQDRIATTYKDMRQDWSSSIKSQTERKKLHHVKHTEAGLVRSVVSWEVSSPERILRSTTHCMWLEHAETSCKYMYIIVWNVWRFLTDRWMNSRRGPSCGHCDNSIKQCNTATNLHTDGLHRLENWCSLEEYVPREVNKIALLKMWSYLNTLQELAMMQKWWSCINFI